MNVLVTGGASGLGEAITRALAARGHGVHFTYHHSADAARALEAELPLVHGHACNFADPASVDALVAALPDLALDGVVHNALTGITRRHVHRLAPEDWLASFQANVLPALRITAALLPGMRERRAGRLVTVLTDYRFGAPPTGMAEYVANKAYLASVVKSWAAENARYGITSNAVSPSTLATGLTADVDERVMAQLVEASPLQRLVTPAEVAGAVLFLLEAGPAVNGVDLPVNAGQTLA